MPPKLNIFHFLKDRRDQFLYFRNGAEVNLWIWVKTQLRPKVYYWTKCGESLNHRSADFLMKFHCFFSFCKGPPEYVVQLLLCVQKEHIQLKVSFFFVWKLSRKVFLAEKYDKWSVIIRTWNCPVQIWQKKILLIVCLVFAVVQPPLKIHFQPQSLVLRGSNRICTYTLQCTAKQDFACRL